MLITGQRHLLPDLTQYSSDGYSWAVIGTLRPTNVTKIL